jgi:hypothetical protein
MTDGLKKDYDGLPQSTRNKITTLKRLCDLFLVNRVMLAVASSILTVVPKASQGDDEDELLEINLQFLTNVANTDGFQTMSG